MAELDEKIFEMIAVGLVVGSRTAVDGLSSDPRCLVVGCWGQ
jgi:hypothetical protein